MERNIQISKVEEDMKLECGIDEAGRGPVIGPLIICIACITKDKYNQLANIVTKDSKGYTPSKRRKLFDVIIENVDYYRILEITPRELNDEMELKTLNEIEYERILLLLRELSRLLDSRNTYTSANVYIDSIDIRPSKIVNRLINDLNNPLINIIMEYKADSKYLPTSIASIIAKVTRDEKIENLKRRYGDFGSGYPSDPKTQRYLDEIIDKLKEDEIRQIIRVKWKTYRRRIKRKLYRSKLDSYLGFRENDPSE